MINETTLVKITPINTTEHKEEINKSTNATEKINHTTDFQQHEFQNGLDILFYLFPLLLIVIILIYLTKKQKTRKKYKFKGHGAYWLIPLTALILFLFSLSPPIEPITYEAKALSEFSRFINQSHPFFEYEKVFCDEGMCISLKEKDVIEDAFSTPQPLLYLNENGLNCTEQENVFLCNTKYNYPLKEKYGKALIKILIPTAIFKIDFENQEEGEFNPSIFGNVEWNKTSLATIEKVGNNKVLKVTYPAGKVGSNESGASFLINIGNYSSCILSYKLYLPPNFDFSKGGKLPGLTYDGSRWTACRKPENGEGYSARIMWREHGKTHLYLYWMEQNSRCGTYFPNIGNSTMELKKNIWNNISILIAPNKGYIKMNINNESYSISNLNFSNNDIGVSHFYFSTFYGGSTIDWAPRETTYAYFDNFTLFCYP